MRFLKFTAVLSLVALMVIGCGDGSLVPGNNGGNEQATTGKLSIASLQVDCRIDERDPEVGLNSATRATRSEANTDNFFCEIVNEQNEVVKSFLFAERPTEDIELPTGSYIFKIRSHNEIAGAAWDAPVYGTEKVFKIVRNEKTTLSQLVCSLLNIKVSVTYAQDLRERLGAKTKTTVTVGENSLVFDLNEERAGFFFAPQESNTIHLSINGTYAADLVNYKDVNMTKKVENVRAGEHSKVHFYLEHAAEGNINVSVEIKDWITDEVVPCDVSDLVTEEEWTENEGGNQGGNEGGEAEKPEVEDPSIIWEGHDISKREQVVPGLDVNIVVESSKGIKEFVVKIVSETLTASELATNNLCDTMNLCYPDQSFDSTTGNIIDVTQPLTDLGFVVGDQVINQSYVRLSISTFMGILSSVSGTSAKNHDFVLTVTDNEGNTTVKTLMLKTGN